MGLNLLPLIAGIAPLLAVTLAHWLGVEAGLLPACIPYIEGCTSISATGRHPPGSFVFKAVQLPFAAMLVFIWYFVAHWLQALWRDVSQHRSRWILTSGLIAAVALVVYTTFLGTSGPVYSFMRRFGIYFYFLGTAVAQIITTISLRHYSRQESLAGLHRIARWMLVLLLVPFALGVLNSVLKAVLENADQSENRIEWIAGLAMQAWFVLLYLAWQKTGFRVSVSTRQSDVDR